MYSSNVCSRFNNIINGNINHKIIRFKNGSYYDFDHNPISKEELYTYMNEAEVLCAHFLSGITAKLVNRFSKGKKIIWFAWGGDIYVLGKFGYGFLLPKTKKLYFKYAFSTIKGLKNYIYKSLGTIADQLYPNKEVLQTISRTNLIVPVVKGDYDNLKSKYEIKAELFEQNYLNDLMVEAPEFRPHDDRKHILVGNSASFTNNHLESIDVIKNANIGDARVYIPMSYGNTWYAEEIKKYAKVELANNAHALLERLPLVDYLDLYMSCKHVIMNHKRQQAMGNFVFAAWSETTIYMNHDGYHTQDLLRRGFHILDTNHFHYDHELNNDQKRENKELLNKWFGVEYLRKRFLEFQKAVDEI